MDDQTFRHLLKELPLSTPKQCRDSNTLQDIWSALCFDFPLVNASQVARLAAAVREQAHSALAGDTVPYIPCVGSVQGYGLFHCDFLRVLKSEIERLSAAVARPPPPAGDDTAPEDSESKSTSTTRINTADAKLHASPPCPLLVAYHSLSTELATSVLRALLSSGDLRHIWVHLKLLKQSDEAVQAPSDVPVAQLIDSKEPADPDVDVELVDADPEDYVFDADPSSDEDSEYDAEEVPKTVVNAPRPLEELLHEVDEALTMFVDRFWVPSLLCHQRWCGQTRRIAKDLVGCVVEVNAFAHTLPRTRERMVQQLVRLIRVQLAAHPEDGPSTLALAFGFGGFGIKYFARRMKNSPLQTGVARARQAPQSHRLGALQLLSSVCPSISASSATKFGLLPGTSTRERTRGLLRFLPLWSFCDEHKGWITEQCALDAKALKTTLAQLDEMLGQGLDNAADKVVSGTIKRLQASVRGFEDLCGILRFYVLFHAFARWPARTFCAHPAVYLDSSGALSHLIAVYGLSAPSALVPALSMASDAFVSACTQSGNAQLGLLPSLDNLRQALVACSALHAPFRDRLMSSEPLLELWCESPLMSFYVDHSVQLSVCVSLVSDTAPSGGRRVVVRRRRKTPDEKEACPEERAKGGRRVASPGSCARRVGSTASKLLTVLLSTVEPQGSNQGTNLSLQTQLTGLQRTLACLRDLEVMVSVPIVATKTGLGNTLAMTLHRSKNSHWQSLLQQLSLCATKLGQLPEVAPQSSTAASSTVPEESLAGKVHNHRKVLRSAIAHFIKRVQPSKKRD